MTLIDLGEIGVEDPVPPAPPVASCRSRVEPSLTWQKSGNVNAPERRSGAATNSSNAR